MKPHIIFDILNQSNSDKARSVFVAYTKEVVLALESGNRPASEVAYDIAGMLSTNFSHSLQKDDPLLEIMTIAGELEVQPENSKELTSELIEKIENLKTKA